MSEKRVLVPLPRHDFDPTEVAVPWKALVSQGIEVVFATPDGQKPSCDARMLTGDGLGPWRPVLRADARGRAAYAALSRAEAFSRPMAWAHIDASRFDALLLPGGHDKGMIEYLESDLLQRHVATFFAENKPVGAICHGVVLAARSKAASGKSVLFGRKTTALLASQELLAWGLTCLWLADYYRTYRVTVEAEVRACLASADDFVSGPMPLFRDSPTTPARGFVVRDGPYLSARWPGDAHAFAASFAASLGHTTASAQSGATV
jgi:protease I